MTLTATRPSPTPSTPAPAPPPEFLSTRRRQVSAATPAAAALSVVLASTAMSGGVAGLRWMGFVMVAAATVAAAGVLLRGIRLPVRVLGGGPLPAVAVVIGQLFALLCLVTAVFTRTGWLAAFPTPTAVRDLAAMFDRAITQIEFGVAPVDATTEVLLLITVGLGLVAVAVDAVAVTAAAPAAAGLVLLCVFAVPASVAETMLPWWSFVAGAAGFAALLAVDGQRRHLAWSGPSNAPADAGAAPMATALAAVAVIVALLAGGLFTVIGTIGRLPGTSSSTSGATAGIGLKPFTALRGQLDRQGVIELFRVRGLDQASYLRALTLRRYVSQQGWEVAGMSGQPVRGDLPLPEGQLTTGRQATIDVEPLNYRDSWLPVYGIPTSLQGVSGNYRYDAAAGTVFSERARRVARYTEQALFPEPSADQLRRASGPDDVDPEYLTLDGVDQRVRQLARDITTNASTRFDRVLAINSYLTNPDNGFTYDLRTRSGNSGDALVDFLFSGKTGYCEQFSSAMGVLLRAVGIPSRVVIGFTAGYESGDARVITTEDLHSWVEAYFPGIGWVTFDPTPLTDGRGITPEYVESPLPTDAAGQPLNPDAASSTPAAPSDEPAPPENLDPAAAAAAGTEGGSADWLRPLAVTVLVLGLLAAIVGAPAMIRQWQRRSRLRAVAAGGSDAATAAWRELLAESWDRGHMVPETDTVRLAANRLAREHDLDAEGRRGLRTVVGAVERSWYGGGKASDPTLTDPTLTDPTLTDAVREVRHSFARNAPLALRAKLLPRSVLRPRRQDAGAHDDYVTS